MQLLKKKRQTYFDHRKSKESEEKEQNPHKNYIRIWTHKIPNFSLIEEKWKSQQDSHRTSNNLYTEQERR